MAVDLEPVGTARVQMAAGVEVALTENVVQAKRLDHRDSVGGVQDVVVPSYRVRMDKEHDVGESRVIFEDVG